MKQLQTERNNSVNMHTLNYTKMDYRNLILRRLHRLRGNPELQAAESHGTEPGELAAVPLVSATGHHVPLAVALAQVHIQPHSAAQLQSLPFAKGTRVF